MKVSQVTSTLCKGNCNNVQNSSMTQPLKTAIQGQDSFVKNPKKLPSFGNNYECLFDVIGTGEKNLKTLAEIFHKNSNSDIQYMLACKYSFWANYNKKAQLAYKTIIPYVEKVRSNKNKLLNEITKLSKKELLGESNIVEQKLAIKNKFLNYIEVENRGQNGYLPNGVMLYGTAEKTEKQEVIDWIKREAQANFVEIQYNPKDPFASIKSIAEKAHDAESTYKYTGTRTLLHVKGLDELFTKHQTIEERGNISRIKPLIEILSEKYHTTLLFHTNKPLEEFESGSIASHRFPMKFDLKDGITNAQKVLLENDRAELKRLEECSKKLDEIYYCKYGDMSDFSGFDTTRG